MTKNKQYSLVSKLKQEEQEQEELREITKQRQSRSKKRKKRDEREESTIKHELEDPFGTAVATGAGLAVGKAAVRAGIGLIGRLVD